MEKVTLMCPCLFGLESVLSFEVKKLGGENIVGLHRGPALIPHGSFDGCKGQYLAAHSRARRNCDRELSGGDIH